MIKLPNQSAVQDMDLSCTANTDLADRGIERLKQEKEQLTKQLKNMSDPEKIKDLESKLKQLENEQQQKTMRHTGIRMR